MALDHTPSSAVWPTIQSVLVGTCSPFLHDLIASFRSGGYHYHKKWDYMRSMMMQKGTPPLIMHMNYNDNIETKRKFNQQMGDWFLADGNPQSSCYWSRLANTTSTGSLPTATACCVAHPQPVCHYRDKPSKIPCRDSPQVEGGESFW